MQCCTRLAENTGRTKSPKNRHLRAIAQLCQAISSQRRHLSTIGKKLVKQQYFPTSSQYGELRPTSGLDRFVSLGHPANLNGFRVLAALLHGPLLVVVSQTAALDRGRHLNSAGRPSRWALAKISSICLFLISVQVRSDNWSLNGHVMLCYMLYVTSRKNSLYKSVLPS